MGSIKQGTKEYHRANIALFAGGLNTFAILYCTQPLLPEFSAEFHISPAVASLSLSFTTITLAISMLFVGSLSEAWGRKKIMMISLCTASVFAFCTAFSSHFPVLLGLRVLTGIVLAGLPSIAMAYLGEEIEARSLGVAMGLYISGNSVGGMGGRIITGTLADHFNWHVALAGIGVLSLVCTILFWTMLPASKNFTPRKLEGKTLAKSLWSHCKDERMLYLFGLSFLFMGSFVTLYNYIGYQLLAPPYSLSQTIVGWIFIVYLVGTFSSAWMGRLADQYGRIKMIWSALIIMFLGVCLTLDGYLLVKIAGIAIFTFGFFGGHSVASGWVGQLATHDKAQASSLYLFCYYAGSSVGGTVGGLFWSGLGWSGVVGFILAFLLIAFILSIRLKAVTQQVFHGNNVLD
ncbi:MFS transporter [Brevibacillus daliensis]|uniref:MFS transporter n=1 Tax=Brevibacillus daliensis TaxID=2892995 RepID=UPI001E293E68|nr:MFS transporter [Brevibacillus daliensis]